MTENSVLMRLQAFAPGLKVSYRLPETMISESLNLTFNLLTAF